MLEKSSFNFGSGKSVTGNIDHVVDTSTDPVVSFVVTASSITSELQKPLVCELALRFEITHVVALVHIQVCIHVSLVSTPDGTSHAGPWLFDSQDTLDVVSGNLGARDGIDNSGLDAKEGKRCTARLGRSNTTQWGDDV